MDELSEKRKGERYLFSEIVLWAFFPIVITLSYAVLPSLVSLAWSAVFATVFLGCIVLYRKVWHEIWNIALWKYLFFITLFIAVLYYVLYFLGLERTTAGNVALVSQFEIFTTFLFFNVLRREYISTVHIVGAALMVLGVLIVLTPNFSGINIGDFFILGATLAAPVGNLYQQKARRIASSEVIVFLRTLLSIPIFFALAYVLNAHASLGDIRSSLLLLMVNGVIFFGLQKILFLEALHRVAITKIMALGALGPFLTLIFAWIFLHQLPNAWQITSLVPLVLGTLLLTDQLGLPGSRLTVRA